MKCLFKLIDPHLQYFLSVRKIYEFLFLHGSYPLTFVLLSFELIQKSLIFWVFKECACMSRPPQGHSRQSTVRRRPTRLASRLAQPFSIWAQLCPFLLQGAESRQARGFRSPDRQCITPAPWQLKALIMLCEHGMPSFLYSGKTTEPRCSASSWSEPGMGPMPGVGLILRHCDAGRVLYFLPSRAKDLLLQGIASLFCTQAWSRLFSSSVLGFDCASVPDRGVGQLLPCKQISFATKGQSSLQYILLFENLCESLCCIGDEESSSLWKNLWRNFQSSTATARKMYFCFFFFINISSHKLKFRDCSKILWTARAKCGWDSCTWGLHFHPTRRHLDFRILSISYWKCWHKLLLFPSAWSDWNVIFIFLKAGIVMFWIF